MAEPPLDTGATKATDTDVSPLVAMTLVGAPGTVTGVTADDAVLGEPEPTALAATTVNV